MQALKSVVVVAGLVAAAWIALPAGQAPSQARAERYHLKGKVVSIPGAAVMGDADWHKPAFLMPYRVRDGKVLIPAVIRIDGSAWGFMPAMTMPYTVKDPGELKDLSPGQEITADVVVPDTSMSCGCWIENIVAAKDTTR